MHKTTQVVTFNCSSGRSEVNLFRLCLHLPTENKGPIMKSPSPLLRAPCPALPCRLMEAARSSVGLGNSDNTENASWSHPRYLGPTDGADGQCEFLTSPPGDPDVEPQRPPARQPWQPEEYAWVCRAQRPAPHKWPERRAHS